MLLYASATSCVAVSPSGANDSPSFACRPVLMICCTGARSRLNSRQGRAATGGSPLPAGLPARLARTSSGHCAPFSSMKRRSSSSRSRWSSKASTQSWKRSRARSCADVSGASGSVGVSGDSEGTGIDPLAMREILTRRENGLPVGSPMQLTNDRFDVPLTAFGEDRTRLDVSVPTSETYGHQDVGDHPLVQRGPIHFTLHHQVNRQPLH